MPELARFGINTCGAFRSLMTKHRRALLKDDRTKFDLVHWRMYSDELGEAFVSDRARRQFWFAYPALVRNAAEMEFGTSAVINAQEPESAVQS